MERRGINTVLEAVPTAMKLLAAQIAGATDVRQTFTKQFGKLGQQTQKPT